MGTHAVSLRALGDVTGVQATVQLEGDRMTIAAGDTDIGSWTLDEVHFEPIPTGYRVAIEGEQILIELKDRDSFDEELNSRSKRRRRRDKASKRPEGDRAPKQSRSRTQKQKASKPKRTPSRDEGDEAPAEAQKPVAEKPATSTGRTAGEGGSRIDQLILSVERRFGNYLPEWVFTKGTLGLSVIGLAIVAVFPGLTSVVLLVIGILLVMIGAVIYTDPVLASRWLPGAMGPQHVLMSGLAVLLLGVVVGLFGT